MNLICGWCGTWQGVSLVTVRLESPLSRCGSRSPFDPRQTCRLPRGHSPLVRCTSEAQPTEMFLCYRCFGAYAESGTRPFVQPAPMAGPITGVPLDLRRLR